MSARISWGVLLVIGLAALTPKAAHAQLTVIDPAAIAHLIEQYEVLQDQLTTALDQYNSLTGDRGMQHLLEGIARNYLPADWATLNQILDGANAAYGDFADELHRLIGDHAILTDEELARLSDADREHLEHSRQTAAMLQALSHDALQTTSERFDTLQGLIEEIGEAEDPKAIMDLQARINSEQAMLANENTKLQTLYQAAQAEQWSQRQQRSEQAIHDLGSLRDLPPLDLPMPQ